MSSPRRLGLPQTVRLRHDLHFVDQLSRTQGQPIGRLVPVEDVEPNPEQPRQDLGDLSELVASVRAKGVLEPILVRPTGGRFRIIAGERRYRAAMAAGLAEIPCIVRDASDSEMMELALVENLQRKDLAPFEEAEGMKALVDRHGYTHEQLAERIGKSRSSITETLTLNAMPADVRDLCRLADIHSKSVLLQVVRQSSTPKMVALIEQLQREGVNRQHARRLSQGPQGRGKGRPRAFVFRYQPREKSFKLALRFKKSQVERDEIVRALRSIIDALLARAVS